MESVYLDTHILIWLYANTTDLIPNKSLVKIKTCNLLVSPMVELELEYLRERKRIRCTSKKIIGELSDILTVTISSVPFNDTIAEAKNIHWTRDPFDRIIVAEAKIQKTSLITKNQIIRKNYKKTIWE